MMVLSTSFALRFAAASSMAPMSVAVTTLGRLPSSGTSRRVEDDVATPPPDNLASAAAWERGVPLEASVAVFTATTEDWCTCGTLRAHQTILPSVWQVGFAPEDRLRVHLRQSVAPHHLDHMYATRNPSASAG